MHKLELHIHIIQSAFDVNRHLITVVRTSNVCYSEYVKADLPGNDGRSSSVKTADLAPMRIVDLGCTSQISLRLIGG